MFLVLNYTMLSFIASFARNQKDLKGRVPYKQLIHLTKACLAMLVLVRNLSFNRMICKLNKRSFKNLQAYSRIVFVLK